MSDTLAQSLNHVGFIMDGNRRWARGKGLPTFEGHRRGYAKLKEVGKWCLDQGINNITVFAFSTENFNRSKEEVNYLMNLLEEGLSRVKDFQELGLRLKIIGRRTGLPAGVLAAIKRAEEQTAQEKNGTLYVGLNYGGRAEIIDASVALLKSGLKPEDINEETLKKYLYAPEAPDPDLIIRTSGEHRTSGFLLWEAAYTEWYFTEVFWPDFSKGKLDEAIKWYKSRQRRFGM
jgi:undecaprenyl diphosphate synthase